MANEETKRLSKYMNTESENEAVDIERSQRQHPLSRLPGFFDSVPDFNDMFCTTTQITRIVKPTSVAQSQQIATVAQQHTQIDQHHSTDGTMAQQHEQVTPYGQVVQQHAPIVHQHAQQYVQVTPVHVQIAPDGHVVQQYAPIAQHAQMAPIAQQQNPQQQVPVVQDGHCSRPIASVQRDASVQRHASVAQKSAHHGCETRATIATSLLTPTSSDDMFDFNSDEHDAVGLATGLAPDPVLIIAKIDRLDKKFDMMMEAIMALSAKVSRQHSDVIRSDPSIAIPELPLNDIQSINRMNAKLIEVNFHDQMVCS